ncbi:hypothetical protein D6827_02725 [Candidatus Parcubacteria bacterium]|nr:MAG: hypothetical protein D6827_02725 [Candidatus Parcubacteria bacterium]
MSQFYNPHRGSDWNYGGRNWKLSRSKIDLFLECPRCFYLDNKLGTKRPPGFPFNLNSAVDALLKKEFDIHRANGEQHPLQEKYGINAIPIDHAKLNMWRDNFSGVQCLHEPTGLTVSGAIDDLWFDPDTGEYIVVDYKATAKEEQVIALDKEWQDSYKRQMEVYQWLLRQNGLPVSNTGYFVYCTGKLDNKAFDGKLEFDIALIPYIGDDSWVEGVLEQIKETLESSTIPESSPQCDYCRYCRAVNQHLEK